MATSKLASEQSKSLEPSIVGKIKKIPVGQIYTRTIKNIKKEVQVNYQYYKSTKA